MSLTVAYHLVLFVIHLTTTDGSLETMSEILDTLPTLIKDFKEYLKKPAPNMNIVNDILTNCRKLNKILDKNDRTRRRNRNRKI